MKNLRIYDFDDTLFHTPAPDRDIDGNKIYRVVNRHGSDVKLLTSKAYEESTGEPWAYVGWWGKAESLDQSIFDIKRNKYVYKEYLKDVSGIDKQIIMMTGRLKKLQNEVLTILDDNNFVFDAYYFNPGGINTFDYKINTLNKYISENKDLETIKMYDDRSEHITNFIKWANDVMSKRDIDIEIIHIKGEGRIN